MDFKTKRFQVVELQIPAGVTGNNQQTYFQNQPQLQSIDGSKRVYIKKVETYTDEDLVGSPLSNGLAMATAANIRQGCLVLSIAGENQVNMIPLANLCTIVPSSGSTTPYNFNSWLLRNQWRVDWSKSYVQTITAPAAVPFTYVFGVHYDYEPDYNDITQDQYEEFMAYAARVPDYPLSFK